MNNSGPPRMDFIVVWNSDLPTSKQASALEPVFRNGKSDGWAHPRVLSLAMHLQPKFWEIIISNAHTQLKITRAQTAFGGGSKTQGGEFSWKSLWKIFFTKKKHTKDIFVGRVYQNLRVATTLGPVHVFSWYVHYMLTLVRVWVATLMGPKVCVSLIPSVGLLLSRITWDG